MEEEKKQRGRPKGSKDSQPRKRTRFFGKWWVQADRISVRLYNATSEDIAEILALKDKINERNKLKALKEKYGDENEY